MRFVAGVCVKGAFQQGLEGLYLGKIPFLRGADRLLAQVVAQHHMGIGLEHQIGLWRSTIKRFKLRIG